MKSNERRKTRGFTLVELVVVLVVLAALAGILLPQFSGVVNRTHTATSATNLSELGKAFALYNVKTLRGYPDKYEGLVTSSGIAPTAVATSGASTLPFDPLDTSLVTVAAPTATQVASLNRNGITSYYPMRDSIPATESATFDAVDSTAATTISTTTKLVFLTTTKAKACFGIDGALLGEDYVCFGIGAQCTAVGTVMQEAPIHFDQTDPAITYERFVAVYAVPNAGGTAFNARLVGFLGTELNSLGNEINEYYSKSSQ